LYFLVRERARITASRSTLFDNFVSISGPNQGSVLDYQSAVPGALKNRMSFVLNNLISFSHGEAG